MRIATSLFLLLCSILAHGRSVSNDTHNGNPKPITMTSGSIAGNFSNFTRSIGNSSDYNGEITHDEMVKLFNDGTSNFHGNRSAREMSLDEELLALQRQKNETAAIRARLDAIAKPAIQVHENAERDKEKATAHAEKMKKGFEEAERNQRGDAAEHARLDGKEKQAVADFVVANITFTEKLQLWQKANDKIPAAKEDVANYLTALDAANDLYKASQQEHKDKKEEDTRMKQLKPELGKNKKAAEGKLTDDEALLDKYEADETDFNEKNDFKNQKIAAESNTSDLENKFNIANLSYAKIEVRKNMFYGNQILQKKITDANWDEETVEEALTRLRKQAENAKKAYEKLLNDTVKTTSNSSVNSSIVATPNSTYNSTKNSSVNSSIVATPNSTEIPLETTTLKIRNSRATQAELTQAKAEMERSMNAVKSLEELMQFAPKEKMKNLLDAVKRKPITGKVNSEFSGVELKLREASHNLEKNLETIKTMTQHLEGVDLDALETAKNEAVANTPATKARIKATKELIEEYKGQITTTASRINALKTEIPEANQKEQERKGEMDTAVANLSAANSTLSGLESDENLIKTADVEPTEKVKNEKQETQKELKRQLDAAFSKLKAANEKLAEATKSKTMADADLQAKTQAFDAALKDKNEKTSAAYGELTKDQDLDKEILIVQEKVKKRDEERDRERRKKEQEEREHQAMMGQLGTGLGVSIALIVILLGGAAVLVILIRRMRKKEKFYNKRVWKGKEGLTRFCWGDYEHCVIPGEEFSEVDYLVLGCQPNEGKTNIYGDPNVGTVLGKDDEITYDPSMNISYDVGEDVDRYDEFSLKDKPEFMNKPLVDLEEKTTESMKAFICEVKVDGKTWYEWLEQEKDKSEFKMMKKNLGKAIEKKFEKKTEKKIEKKIENKAEKKIEKKIEKKAEKKSGSKSEAETPKSSGNSKTHENTSDSAGNKMSKPVATTPASSESKEKEKEPKKKEKETKGKEKEKEKAKESKKKK